MSTDTIQTPENGTVSSKPRKKNSEIRDREHLHRHEVDSLIALAKKNKRGGDQPIGQRHALMISMAFNHALRVSELVNLRWQQIDFKTNTVVVTRLKGSKTGTHNLNVAEARTLRLMKAKSISTEFVFPTERGGPMTIRGFHKLFADLGKKAGISFTIHPHMLRHAKGYDLVNKGTDCRLIQEYMGHASISNTVKYTALSPQRLRGLES